MPRWITRRTNDGTPVKAPLPCYDPSTIAAIPGMRTVEECVFLLLNEGEHVEARFERSRIDILRGHAVVGYFEIERREIRDAPAPDLYRQLTSSQLESLLRDACNHLDVINDIQGPSDLNAEARSRIQQSSEIERGALRLHFMAMIDAVRNELGRRTGAAGKPSR